MSCVRRVRRVPSNTGCAQHCRPVGLYFPIELIPVRRTSGSEFPVQDSIFEFATTIRPLALASSSRSLAQSKPTRDADKGINELAIYYTVWCNVSMDQLTDVLTAISHPSRRAIIGQLANGPARFLDIAKPFDTALNAVTKHLKLLERAGLIERRKQGREVFISFRGEPLREVASWVHEYERFWNTHLDQFQQYFKHKQKKKEKK
jgi:DNA-binding transcriptional ArsR family regulator